MNQKNPGIHPELSPGLSRAFIGLFVCFMLFPHLDLRKSSLDALAFSVVESRQPSPKPDPVSDLESLKNWMHKWNAYYTDRMGFRQEALVTAQWLKWKLNLPTPQVIWGKDGWVFLNKIPGLDMPAYLRGTVAWGPDHARMFLRVMAQRQAWLAEQGIPLLVVMPPVKGLVYPECLPGDIRPMAPSLREQVLEEIKQSGTPLHFLDLLPDLLAAKAGSPPLYYRTDTHWNERGAYVGYQAIIRELKQYDPGLEPIPENQFQQLAVPCMGLDLGVMSQLGKFLSDVRYDTTPAHKTHVQRVKIGEEIKDQEPTQCFHLAWQNPITPVTVYTDLVERPRVLVIRDSYAGWLSFYLNETFHEVHYVPHFGCTFDPKTVLEMQPDLVIYQLLDRVLLQFDPKVSRTFEREILGDLDGSP
jgi:alginate O-acetyltransferase complex protein AlgJ